MVENEIWKEIENNINYEVSNKGRVRNKLTNYILKQGKNPGGYMVYNIKDAKSSLVHLLVANAFIPKIDNKNTVDHIDRNRSNNHVDNLRWATTKEQCENRNWSKGNFNRKIQQFDKETSTLIKTFETVDDAVNYIYLNKLCNISTKKSSIKSILFQTLQYKKDTLYGYIWKYETNEEVFENEVWKSVKEIYPDANDYKISNLGRVKNPKSVFVKGTNTGGYNHIYIGIKGIRKRLHRLVAKLFIPNPKNKRCVNHIDGDKKNNCVYNLEWNSHSENVQHAMDNNLNPCCKRIKVTKLDSKIETIYPSIAEASRNLKIQPETIGKYIKNKKSNKNTLFELLDNKHIESRELFCELQKIHHNNNPEARRKTSDSKGQNKPFDVFKKDKKETIFIKSFDYQFEAMEYLQTTYKIKTQIKICDVLKGNRNSSHGFTFKYKE